MWRSSKGNSTGVPSFSSASHSYIPPSSRCHLELSARAKGTHICIGIGPAPPTSAPPLCAVIRQWRPNSRDSTDGATRCDCAFDEPRGAGMAVCLHLIEQLKHLLAALGNQLEFTEPYRTQSGPPLPSPGADVGWGEPSPGADVGWGEPSPGAGVAECARAMSPVSVQERDCAPMVRVLFQTVGIRAH